MAITTPNDLNDDYGMSGQYLATWRAIRNVLDAKTRESSVIADEVKDALDLIEAGQFDPSRIDDLIARLDNIITPAPVTLPAAPYVEPLTHSSRTLPTLDLKTPNVPVAPGDRVLMEFGAAPTLSTAGDPSTMQDYRHLMTAERDALLDMVLGKFDEFIAEFMPPPQHLGEAMQWLSDAVNARNTGIPIVVEAQIHERNRARIHKETTRLIATAKATWASKGYTIPPGALQGQVHDLRRDQLEQLSTSSRELTIYVTEKHIENARFAVEQLLTIRPQVINAALDYMKALIVSPQQAGDWLSAMIDNRTKVAQAEADIYKARAGVAAEVFKVQTGADVDRFKTLADVNIEDAKQGNSAQAERFRAILDQEKHAAQVAIEQFRARTGTDLEAYKITSNALMQYYETETRVAGLKADVLGKTADTALKLEELKFGRENQIAKMRVDVTMERLKTIAQQASAALNNLQLSASSGTSYNISQMSDE